MEASASGWVGSLKAQRRPVPAKQGSNSGSSQPVAESALSFESQEIN